MLQLRGSTRRGEEWNDSGGSNKGLFASRFRGRERGLKNVSGVYYLVQCTYSYNIECEGVHKITEHLT